jgi:hypothetical protein
MSLVVELLVMDRLDVSAVLVNVQVTKGPVSPAAGWGKLRTKDCVEPDATVAPPAAASLQT